MARVCSAELLQCSICIAKRVMNAMIRLAKRHVLDRYGFLSKFIYITVRREKLLDV